MIRGKTGKRKLVMEKSIVDAQRIYVDGPQRLLSSNSQPVSFIEPPEKMCPSLIWKLNVDCFYEICDYLTLDDLIAIGQTCKRFQFIAGDFIKENYVAKRKTCQNTDIHMDWPPKSVKIFSDFLEKVYIFGNFASGYKFVGSNCTEYLREIRMSQIDLTDYEIESIKGVLAGVEVIEMEHCALRDEFYEHFLQFCPKLKSLSVSRSSYDRDRGIIIGSSNEWLRKKYPTLEHLELTNLYELKENELQAFFEQNPNVRSFSTDAKSILFNRDTILESGIKLNELAVEFHPQVIDSEVEPIAIVEFFHKQLVKLHASGFFRTLHLYISFLDHQNSVQKLLKLDSLTMLGGYINCIESPTIQLEELNVTEASDVRDLETFPDKMPNLERINFSGASSDHILPFIRSSPKLKIMKIENLLDGNHLVGGVLDLIALNNARKGMARARKLIIFVNERVYLATKWAQRQMFFSLIELRRGESFEWNGLNSNSKFVRSF